MIHFFRDILDGPIYIVVVIISIILIMAIIGFMMERKRLEQEKKEKIVVISKETPVTPMEPVNISMNVENTLSSDEMVNSTSSPSFTIGNTISDNNINTNINTPSPINIPFTNSTVVNTNNIQSSNENFNNIGNNIDNNQVRVPYIIDNSTEKVEVSKPIIENSVNIVPEPSIPLEMTQPTPIIIADDILENMEK